MLLSTSIAAGTHRYNLRCTGWVSRVRETRSLDHLVGASEQREREGDAQRLGSIEVDDQLVLGWRLHRQVGRFVTSQDSAGLHAPLLEGFSSRWRSDEFDQGLGRIGFLSTDQDATRKNGHLLDVRR
jgi:hypothetical protein